jgi:sentrin-specific protease 7
MAKHDLSPESAPNNIAESELPPIKYDLGEPWNEPVVYPPSAKKQITVYQENLKALDEGEWLNDNIIEFYILWLQEMIKVPQHQMYIFPTHFYTRLTEKDSSRPSLPINYANVERWTTRAKVDIFAYDFVLMPINEGSHWYLAIICNLPNLRRRLALEYDTGGDQGAKHEAEAFIDPGVDGRRGNANYASQRRMNHYENHSGSELSVQYSQMSIKDPHSAAPYLGEHPHDTDAMDVDNEEIKPNPPVGNRPSSWSSVRPDTPTTSPAPGSQRTPSSAIGVFQGAKTSPRMSNKSRTKSGHGRRKYDPSLPAIVILDSLHWDHHPAIGHIKDYLITEALSKRSLTIERKGLQGLHVKEGIPKQDNFNDCGLYMLGFIQKFMDDPKEFARKCLRNDFDESTDWPNMMPNEMRSWIRGELLKIHDEQMMAKEEKRRNKKAAKRAEKQAVAQSSQSSPGKDPVPTSPTEEAVLNKDLHPQVVVETSAAQAIPSNALHPEVVIDTSAAFAPQAPSPVKKPAQELQTQMDTNSNAPAPDPFVDSMKATTEQNQENSDVMLLDEEPLTEAFATERDRGKPATTETGDASSRDTLEALGLNRRQAQGTSDTHGAHEPSTEEASRPKTRGKRF